MRKERSIVMRKIAWCILPACLSLLVLNSQAFSESSGDAASAEHTAQAPVQNQSQNKADISVKQTDSAQKALSPKPSEYDIASCIKLADKSHPDIGPAYARLLEAGAMIREAKAGLFPVVKFNGGYKYLVDTPGFDDYEPGGADRSYDFQWSGHNIWRGELQVEWPIFTWNRVQNTQKTAEFELNARRKEFIRIREQAISDAIMAYWTLASAKEAGRYLDITMHELSLFYRVAKHDQEQGMPNAPEKDVMQIKIDLDKMRAWRGTIEKWAEQSRQALAIAIGMPGKKIKIVDDRVIYRPVKIRFSSCLNTAYRYRADLKALNNRIEEARLRISVEKKANWPTLALVGGGYVQDDNFEPSHNSNAMVGVQLSGTIFDGFKSSARTDQAAAKLRELVGQQYKLKQQIRQQVRDAYLRVKEAYLSLKAYRDARDRTLRKLQLVRQGYPLQVSDVEDVLETQVERRWRDAEYIFAKLSMVKALAELNYACGAGVYDFSSVSSAQ